MLICINGKFLDGLDFEQNLLMLNGNLINLGKLIHLFDEYILNANSEAHIMLAIEIQWWMGQSGEKIMIMAKIYLFNTCTPP